MRVICKYSATEFKLPDFRGSLIEGIHPLFSLTTAGLLTYAKDWAADKLSETESRVLFLALLASGTTETDEYDFRGVKKKTVVPLIVFRTSAIPSHEIVQANMERLMTAMVWIDNISSALLKLPRFAIDHDNRDLKTIPNWLKCWEEERKAFYDNHKSRAMAEKLSSLEEQLMKLIRSEHRKTESYAGTLAKWALDASGFPDKTKLDKETRALWTKVFKLKGFDIFTADKDTIEDVLNWMTLNLTHGSTMAHETMKHLHKVHHANLYGLNKSLGLTGGKTFELLEDPIAEHNMAIIASKAPEIFPELADYPTRVAYLRARAAWNMAETMKAKVVEDAAEQKKKLQELEALDFITDEEAEVNAQEDFFDNLDNISTITSTSEDKDFTS